MYRHRVDFPGKYPVCGEEIKNTSMGGGALAPKSVNISHYISSYHKWFEPIRKFDHIIFGLVYRCTVTSGPAGSLAGCSRRYEVVSRNAIIGKKSEPAGFPCYLVPSLRGWTPSRTTVFRIAAPLASGDIHA